MVNSKKTMKAFGCIFFVFSSFYSCALALTTDAAEADGGIGRRQLLTFPGGNNNADVLPDENGYKIDPSLTFANARQRRAYIALQALKKTIYSDPNSGTANWDGSNVCAYSYVVCTPTLEDPNMISVTTVNLNDFDIAGYLPVEIGFLTDIRSLFLSNNRFSGTVPASISNLKFLSELDLSLNRFGGPFPMPVLSLPGIKFLDIRYNDFEGPLPPELFNMKLDVLFINNNRFQSSLPDTIGNSTVTVLSLNNNNFSGCIPESIGRMPHLEQVLMQSNSFSGCFPEGLTKLKNLKVLEIGDNYLVGSLPKSIGNMKNIVEFDVSYNEFTGKVPKQVCTLPKLERLGITGNYLERKDRSCGKVQVLQQAENCFVKKQDQRSKESCKNVLSRAPVDCSNVGCRRSNPQPIPNPSQPPLPGKADPKERSSIIDKMRPPPVTPPLTPPLK